MFDGDLLIADKTIALVIAAGYSHRFGSDKRLALLSNGNQVIVETVSQIIAAQLDYRIAVQADQLNSFSEIFDADKLLGITDSQLGMGHTIAKGLSLIKQECTACIICLADMPYVLPNTYQAIAAGVKGFDAAVPYYQGRKGNPVAINQTLFSDFLALNGDAGGRAILETPALAIQRIEVDDPGIHQDIDLPSDLLSQNQ